MKSISIVSTACVRDLGYRAGILSMGKEVIERLREDYTNIAKDFVDKTILVAELFKLKTLKIEHLKQVLASMGIEIPLNTINLKKYIRPKEKYNFALRTNTLIKINYAQENSNTYILPRRTFYRLVNSVAQISGYRYRYAKDYLFLLQFIVETKIMLFMKSMHLVTKARKKVRSNIMDYNTVRFIMLCKV